MAANDEFPRGWTLTSAPGGGNTAEVVVAGVTGVSRIIDAFYAKVIDVSAGDDYGSVVILSSTGGTFTNFPLGILTMWDVPATGASDEASGDNLELALAPGEGFTILIPVGAHVNPFLMVQGHDI